MSEGTLSHSIAMGSHLEGSLKSDTIKYIIQRIFSVMSKVDCQSGEQHMHNFYILKGYWNNLGKK